MTGSVIIDLNNITLTSAQTTVKGLTEKVLTGKPIVLTNFNIGNRHIESSNLMYTSTAYPYVTYSLYFDVNGSKEIALGVFGDYIKLMT